MKTLHIVGALSLALLLAACGSDDSDGAPAAPPLTLSEVPDSALASSQAFVQFVGSLPASDTAEPLRVMDAAAPMNDSEEPAPLS
jgi:uncharacterized lipoprotein YbaY